MHTLYGRAYRLLLRLHPATFYDQFAREMALDFEDALQTYGVSHLFLDAARSLARQWFVSIFSADPASIFGPRPSLLAGNYVMVCNRSLTPLKFLLGLIASVTQLALCLFALSVRSGNVSYLPTGAGAPPARMSPSLKPLPSNVSGAPLGCTLADISQTAQPKPELLLFHSSGPLPSYEVATIKLIDPDTASDMVKLAPGVSLSPLSIRRYIMNAYGAVYPPQVVGGPDWLNKDAYEIKGKVPDDLEAALQKMNHEERSNQTRMMEQCLLADRFHLKTHFETRVLPVYELVPAKGGLKLAEVPAPPDRKPNDPPMHSGPDDPLPPGSVLTTLDSNGLRVLNGRAIKMPLLARVIVGDVGDRPIVDHTGFSGYFNITNLTWAPLGETGATNEPDAASLKGALKEKLGLRIIPAKDPIEVLVIDSIERPTPN